MESCRIKEISTEKYQLRSMNSNEIYAYIFHDCIFICKSKQMSMQEKTFHEF